ncbi:hypothetical protein F383_35789 [Gossypium arboreum]|uniref:Uncharacterized protein n=1 Tax=Gossypium arboreum TaxID=29729 RepID=A0A0B0NC70_GOSAR|nr:hypothetical protein F383_35789 [Gossypium arboreum]
MRGSRKCLHEMIALMT